MFYFLLSKSKKNKKKQRRNNKDNNSSDDDDTETMKQELENELLPKDNNVENQIEEQEVSTAPVTANKKRKNKPSVEPTTGNDEVCIRLNLLDSKEINKIKMIGLVQLDSIL